MTARTLAAAPLAFAAAMAASLVAAETELANDAPPTPPGSPRATFYDGAGGEVFWQRASDDRGVRGYEVTIDGRVVATRDATSYYDASFDDRLEYAIRIVTIDTAGQRSDPFFLTLSGEDAGGPDPDGPSFPAELRVSIYSPRDAELFWARVPERVLRYEIFDGDELLATTDGTSAYFDGLESDTSYRLSVIAIDERGRRSMPATISFTTDGRGAVGPEVFAPRDLDLAVYSSTVAELFWTPYTDSSPPSVVSYEIRRDGELIAALAGRVTRSYVDGNRVPGREYAYEVVAVRSDGSRAGTTLAGGGTQPPVGPPTGPAPGDDALPDGIARALAVEFEVLNGTAAERVAALLVRITDALAAGDAESLGLEPGPVSTAPNGPPSPTWRCPGGGDLVEFEPSGTVSSTNAGANADDCAIGPYVIVGHFANRVGDSIGGRQLSTSFVSVDDARDLSTTSFSGLNLRFFADRPGTNTFAVRNLVVDRLDAPYVARAVDNVGVGRGPQLPGGGNGVAVSSGGVFGGFDADDDGARASTVNAITYADGGLRDGRPIGGRVLIESGADSYTIDALTEDPERFRLIVNAGGSTTSYDLPWSDDYRLRPIDPARVDTGL